ncbi:TetR/AcrR family transcriptional regulator [Xanthobacter agilis]|uniref:AcrR family transcriptional regulator n=1 Tax=Xanthobacter agilis TaxID=47492 RepID=A0ABU0LA19_XANAG|nr:TetR/AcrR family transcriptional regulator [Xanthobacter agilis]MDQ0503966.1 AcrR family transcriptional regulator [Xanthobacter agilis]
MSDTTRAGKREGPSDAAPAGVAGDLFAGEISERYRAILEAAASLFAERGYAATSVRDIGERVGLLGGSLYHYIKSKELLFIKIHDTALQVSEDRIRAAIERERDPWARLEAACVTMLGIQLDPRSITMPLMNDFLAVPRHVQESLIAKRDAFEQIFVVLVDDLPLAEGIDRGVYRLLLLTLLNNVGLWYRPGRLSPEEIGGQIVRIFRHEVQAAPSGGD